MAIGRTFQESLQKGATQPGNRAQDRAGPGADRQGSRRNAQAGTANASCASRVPERMCIIADAFRARHDLRGRPRADHRIDPWFLAQIEDLVDGRGTCASTIGIHRSLDAATPVATAQAARASPTSDLAALLATTEAEVRASMRHGFGIRPGLQAGRYLRGRVRHHHRLHVFHLRGGMRGRALGPRPSIMVLGGGPNRIGQGIEFDYCCCPCGAGAA